MEALLVLSLQNNSLWADGGKALAEGLKGNRVITELNIGDNNLGRDGHSGNPDISGVTAIANVIQDMRALTKFDVSSNNIRAEGGKALAAGLKGNQVITELNISSNNLSCNSDGYSDTSGVIAIADAIPDMGALSKLIFGKLLSRHGLPTRTMGR
jgi:Ran GTPase-activating protein (RanGAP) involved in mRNA processing and transport